jgi:hypothetical protein
LEAIRLFSYEGVIKFDDLEDEVQEEEIEILEPYPEQEFTRCTLDIFSEDKKRPDAEAVVRLILDLPPFQKYFSVLPFNPMEKKYINWFINAQRARYLCKRDEKGLLVDMTVDQMETAAQLFE